MEPLSEMEERTKVIADQKSEVKCLFNPFSCTIAGILLQRILGAGDW
jgi:hypothetical protein